jgi:hypothetical protein
MAGDGGPGEAACVCSNDPYPEQVIGPTCYIRPRSILREAHERRLFPDFRPVLDPGVVVDLHNAPVELVRAVLPWLGDPVLIAVHPLFSPGVAPGSGTSGGLGEFDPANATIVVQPTALVLDVHDPAHRRASSSYDLDHRPT